VPFIALTEKAFTHIVNEHYAVLQRAISAHERLERIVLSEHGLDGVAAALSSLIGGPALIFDARGDVLARRAFKRELREAKVGAVAAELRERLAAGHRRSFAPGGLRAGRRHGRSRCRYRVRRAATVSRPRRRPGWWRPRTRGS
jgi:purine catabolism regulator